MLMSAVARVEDGDVDPTGVGEQVGGPARAVTHDDGVGPHGHDRLGRVLERLALGDARPLGGEVDDVGAQTLGGGFKG